MKNTRKPKRLRPGGVIGVFAPSSPAANDEKVERGIRYLEGIGFRVEVGKSVYKRYGYLAGKDQARADDIHSFFRNRNISALIATRGGYGIHRILSRLDYSLIKNHPKIVVGYSDLTAMHCAFLSQANLVSFSGPMVASAMSDGSLSGSREEEFWQMLMSDKPVDPICPTNKNIVEKNIRIKGSIAGNIIGGNLSLLTALVGTPYLPSFRNAFLLLEDIGERPYRIDRMLQQLKLGGVLSNLGAVLLGNFRDCEPEHGKPSLTLPEIFRDTFSSLSYPILSGFHYGHIPDSLSFPFGVKARLHPSKKRMEFLEAGVC